MRLTTFEVIFGLSSTRHVKIWPQKQWGAWQAIQVESQSEKGHDISQCQVRWGDMTLFTLTQFLGMLHVNPNILNAFLGQIWSRAARIWCYLPHTSKNFKA